MRWMDAVAGMSGLLSVEAASGTSIEVNKVEYDSRRVGGGDVFVAMRGGVADGNRYIETAIAQGAAGVVTDSREAYEGLRLMHPEVGAALVERGRRGLAEVAANVLEHPERRLALSGVTGSRSELPAHLHSFVARVRSYTQDAHIPLAVGFGLSTPAHIATVTSYADGAIIGSALVNLLEKTDASQQPEAVRSYIASLRVQKAE